MNNMGSREAAAAALRMALSANREDERALKAMLQDQGTVCAAVDYGGEYLPAILRIIERAVVAAKREGVIGETHAEEGAIAGATHEALAQLTSKAIGLSIGGKIGIARANEHVAVALFFGVGLLHLNEVAVGLGHRVI